MTFDEKLKARAEREGSPTPEGFDDRIANRLQSLPAPERPTRRLPLRRAVVVGIAAALCLAGAAAAAPAVLSMARGAIRYFESDSLSDFRSRQDQFEQYNAAVDMSQTVDGVTLTIDNLAVDDSYFNIFYTLTSETPLEKPGTDSEPESLRAKWSALNFYAQIGDTRLTPSNEDTDAYFVDDQTLKGLSRLRIKSDLADTFDFLLYVPDQNLLSEAPEDAAFRFALSIDKTSLSGSTGTASPNAKLAINGHNITIERVSVSPSGNTITIHDDFSHAEPALPWDFFVLRDEGGKYLLRANEGLSSGRTEANNAFEFYGADSSTRAVTLIPYRWEDIPSQTIFGSLDDLPLRDDLPNGRTLESLELGDHQATATFSVRGALPFVQDDFELLDENGKSLSFNKFALLDSVYDTKTDCIVATLYYPDASDEEIAKIAGVSFFGAPSLTLLEDQAITSYLQ